MRSALARRMRAVALTSGQTDDVTTNCDLVRVTETTAHQRPRIISARFGHVVRNPVRIPHCMAIWCGNDPAAQPPGELPGLTTNKMNSVKTSPST
jgi:hypothetical protein